VAIKFGLIGNCVIRSDDPEKPYARTKHEVRRFEFSKMAAGHGGQPPSWIWTGNSAIRSADTENPILEMKNQTWSGPDEPLWRYRHSKILKWEFSRSTI